MLFSLAISFSSSQAMDGSDDIEPKLMRTPASADFAILPLKTQNIFGPLAGNLMGSGMLSVKHAETIMTLSPFQNPLCGQSRNSPGSLGIRKWLSC